MQVIISIIILITALAHAAPTTSTTPTSSLSRRAVNPALVPSYGVTRNTNANAKQRGSCDGSNGQKTVLIPCTCPPERDAFLSKLSTAVAQGNVFGENITFSEDAADQSEATNKKRATAMLIVLQSFNGTKGRGCPGASAPNFLLQQRDGKKRT
ncbi:hypothetical protein MCOR25_003568 [Pyricularia grisea]|uniref:Uncharacterized protein n=1 Tax=Pyricularia grisea TaxID=148305 RepID=A0A6P8BIU4_PYRGI|nr:uncharacterized protein PgNI_02529 [Pyricularia grisea]KAI6373038.1 hypothetical protein MCOR25_003568 [Pyricularia grisea]TLD16811.1 hypothetical protein PgNI_02529 [Pyricularia grisea]